MAVSKGMPKEKPSPSPGRVVGGESGPGLRPSHNGFASEAIRDAGLQVASEMLIAAEPETACHSDDVEILAGELCGRLGIAGQSRAMLLLAARLHDIGKVALPRELLSKRGPLEPADWRLIKQHTIVGERILAGVPELAPAARLVRHSHENFDGTGYPDGLRGEEIPLGSRIIFCVDAFHAIRSDRPYSSGRSTEAAFAEIRANSGSQFDPDVVNALGRAIASSRRPSRRPTTHRLAELFGPHPIRPQATG